jgi:hypothetical protein
MMTSLVRMLQERVDIVLMDHGLDAGDIRVRRNTNKRHSGDFVLIYDRRFEDVIPNLMKELNPLLINVRR